MVWKQYIEDLRHAANGMHQQTAFLPARAHQEPSLWELDRLWIYLHPAVSPTASCSFQSSQALSQRMLASCFSHLLPWISQ